MRVCVLGAGIAGVTTAYRLNREGFDVTVIERQSCAAMETSFANGAQLSVSNAQPWAQPGMVLKALKWVFKEDSSLFIRPALSWREWYWIAGFFANCRAGAAERNTAALVKLCLRSRDLYYEMLERENIEFDFSARGVLHFYLDGAEYERAKRLGAWLADDGRVLRTVVDAPEILRIEPALERIADRVVGGFYAAEDATGDAHLFCRALAAICRDRGVEFRYDTAVTGLTPGRGEIVVGTDGGAVCADHAVCCLGSCSPLLLRAVGVFVNVYPVKGYSLTIQMEDAASLEAAPSVSVLDDRRKIVASRLGGRLRVAGTAELDGYNLDIRRSRIEPLTRWVRELFPQISLEYAVPWAGLRPATPSNLPYVGKTRHPRLWLNTGHGSLGWTSAMATAEQVSHVILKCRV